MLTLAACAAVLATLPACGGTAQTYAAEDSGLVVLRRSEGEDPRSIDPQKAGDVISSRHCGMCYETLLQYDYLADQATLVPCLASDMPAFDDATKTYTFKLRDDVYFTDDRCFHPDAKSKTYEQEGDAVQGTRGKGRKLVAADLIYSFKRLAALPDSGGYWVIEHKIEGLDDFQAEAVKLKGKGPKDSPDKDWNAYFDTPVAGLFAPDDRTFCVRLTEIYPQFLGAITLSYGAAVAREAAEYYGSDLFRHPVGTGPFVLKRWRLNRELVYERSPTFRDERFPTSNDPDNKRFSHLFGKKLPIADRVIYSIIKDSQPEFLEFQAGNLDVVGIDKDQFSSVMISQTEVSAEMKAKGIQLQMAEQPTIHYLSYNMTDKVVGEPAGEKGRAIRRAITLSIDRDDYIRRFLNNRGTPAKQLVPPSIFGSAHDCDMPSQRLDPEAGRKALLDAGFKLEGAPLRAIDPATNKQVTVTILHRSNDAEGADFAKFLTACGEKVGIRIENERLTFGEFLKRQDDGAGQIYDAGWVMDYPDAQNMLQLLFGPNKPPGINSASYSSKEYDQLYLEMARLDQTNDVQKARKAELIKQMHKVLDHDVPWTLFEFAKAYALHHDWYTMPKPNAFAYTYAKFISADTAKRAEKANICNKKPLLPAAILLALIMIPAALMGWRVYKQAK